LFRITMQASLGLVGLELLSACQPAAPAKPADTPPQPAAAPTTSAPVVSAPPAGQPTGGPAVAAGQPVKGGELILHFRTEMPTLDPPVPNSDPQSRLVNSLVEPLVWQPEPGKFYPGLAESWEVAPDAKLYTFKLRKNVKFHDGTPFDANAVKATFDRVVDPQLKALLVGLLGPYDGSEVVDDATLKVRFKDQFPLFLHNLSATGIRPVSPTAVKQFGPDFGQHVVGTGPFMLKEFSSEQIVFERFPDYNWAPDFLSHTGPANLDRIVHRLIPEASTRLIALEKGEAQYIDSVPEAEVKRLLGSQNLAVDIIPVPGLPQILQMNVTKPPLDDKKVRQAIQFAVDRQKLVDVLFFGVRKPGYNVLASPTTGYWKGAEEVYKFNPDRAKSLLEEAGWRPGPDGIRVNGGEPLSLLYITTNTAELTRTAEVVQDMLRQVGIEMKVDAMTNAASLAKYQLNEHHIGRLGEINADPSVMAFPVHSRNIQGGTQGNRSRYSNPDVDAKLDAAAKEIDPNTRLQVYEELQKTVMDEAFILGTFEQTLVFARSKSIQDLSYDNLGRHFFHKTWLTR
jgi:peptide/nickel transport system substrate-binding protein